MIDQLRQTLDQPWTIEPWYRDTKIYIYIYYVLVVQYMEEKYIHT